MISVMQDGAAVTGLVIAGASLIAVNVTGNAIYDPIGSIIVGNLLGMVFFFQNNKFTYTCIRKSWGWKSPHASTVKALCSRNVGTKLIYYYEVIT